MTTNASPATTGRRQALPEPLWLVAAGAATLLLALALVVAGAGGTEGVDGSTGPAAELYLGLAVAFLGTTLLLVGVVAVGVRLGLRSMGIVPGQVATGAPAVLDDPAVRTEELS